MLKNRLIWFNFLTLQSCASFQLSLTQCLLTVWIYTAYSILLNSSLDNYSLNYCIYSHLQCSLMLSYKSKTIQCTNYIADKYRKDVVGCQHFTTLKSVVKLWDHFIFQQNSDCNSWKQVTLSQLLHLETCAGFVVSCKPYFEFILRRIWAMAAKHAQNLWMNVGWHAQLL